MRKFLSLLVLLGLILAGTKNAFGQSAQKAWNDKRFKDAITLFTKSYSSDSANLDALYHIAEGYRLVKDYGNAEKWYGKLLASRSDPEPQQMLHYAEVLANNSKYETAELWYRRFLVANSGDSRGEAFARSYRDLASFFADSSQWKVEFLSINTDRADFSPAYYRDGLVFTSNRNPGFAVKRVFKWDNSPFTDLYYVDTASIRKVDLTGFFRDSTQTRRFSYSEDPAPVSSNDSKILGAYDAPAQKLLEEYSLVLTKAVPFNKYLNSKYHDGPAIFNGEEDEVILNRNNYLRGKEKKSSDGVTKLKLFEASLVDEKWQSLSELPFNSNEYSTGHPALSADGTILFFVSDMVGGYGRSDLYYSVKGSDGRWGKPVNLGPRVNTEGDEMFPYVDSNGNLYFSSNGLAGLGGLDIFFVSLKDLLPAGEPINLGYPINTSKDDFGIIMRGDNQQGFFSSNRRGNDDIYSFSFEKITFKLHGAVTDGTNTAVSGVRIRLKSGNHTDSLVTDSAGAYSFDLKRNTDYEVEFLREGFVPARAYVSTKGRNNSETFSIPIMLEVMNDAQKQVFLNCDSLRQELYVDNIYFDLDKDAVRSEDRPTLQKLAGILEKNPDVEVIIGAHTDSRASNAYNVRLSKNRANSAKNFLVKSGIASARIRAEYFGETHLVNACVDGVACPEHMQLQNRRAEFQLVKNGVNITLDCGFYKVPPAPEPVLAGSGSETLSELCAMIRGELGSGVIYYDFDKSGINNEAAAVLDKVVDLLNSNPKLKLMLMSHTDSRAKKSYNWELSKQRALSAKEYLVKNGIQASRVYYQYFSENQLTNSCDDHTDCTDEMHLQNRRTEIYFIKGYDLIKCD
ncbi:MAG TPA: OmpA family protein [Sphingobacteriaceae bacterium]